MITQDRKDVSEEEREPIIMETKSKRNEKSGEPKLFGEDEDRVPLLFVDVNIEDGKNARIVVYEGDKSDELARRFSKEYSKKT